MSNDTPGHTFEGFSIPNGTQVPDIVFDDLLARLSGAELKVLMYIIRRTLGFRRDGDNISLSQMLTGIRKRDGTVLDRGTGLSKKTLLTAINSLEDQGYILTQRRRSPEKGDEPTTYRLHLKSHPLVPPADEETTPPVAEKLHQGGGGETTPGPWRKNSATQQTALQATAKQQVRTHPDPFSAFQGLSPSKFERAHAKKIDEGDELQNTHRAQQQPPRRPAGFESVGTVLRHSAEAREYQLAPSTARALVEPTSSPATASRAKSNRRPTRPRRGTDAAQAIRADLERYAEELGDEAPLSSTLTRVVHLYEQSELTIGGFLAQMNDARRETLRRSGNIRKQRTRGGPGPAKNRTPYFLSLLADYLGLKEPAAEPPMMTSQEEPSPALRAPTREPRPAVSHGGRPAIGGPYVRVVPRRDDEDRSAAQQASFSALSAPSTGRKASTRRVGRSSESEPSRGFTGP